MPASLCLRVRIGFNAQNPFLSTACQRSAHCCSFEDSKLTAKINRARSELDARANMTSCFSVLDGQLANESAEGTSGDDSRKVKIDDSVVATSSGANAQIHAGYKCRYCGLTYNYLTTLRAHERVHNVEEPFKCAICSLSYRYNSELQAHSLEHSRPGKQGYKCECGRTFVNYSDLLWHKHPGDADEPEEVLKTLPPLKYTSDSSTTRKPYMCVICKNAYEDSNGLRKHMYSHRGERAFNLVVEAEGSRLYKTPT